MFPVDPITIGRMLEPLGLAAGPVVPTREWRELYAALDCAVVAAIHPFYTASVREFKAAGRDVIGSAPVGVEGTAAWFDAIGEACGIPVKTVDAAKAPVLAATRAALAGSPITARITLSGYEGSELIVGRLLKESGADLRYVGTACPKTPWNSEDAAWLTAHGVHVEFRASLEKDIAAVDSFDPELAIGTTPVVQYAKQKSIPALYFTNLISARPLMGPAGAGSLGTVINAAVGNKSRFDTMTAFFEGVGKDHTAGIWNDPNRLPSGEAKSTKPLVAAKASVTMEDF